ncbi:MAG: hypothetical protein K0Q60_4201 [Microvirga sp.]|jgi:hypothetical protein|nr:hypothetical protein [Microvirga sp.]
MNLPALCDQAIRDLSEARDMEAVKVIHTAAEMMRLHARQRRLGAQAQNRCTEVVVLVEKRIGQEVEKGRAEGTIMKARQNRSRHELPGSRETQVTPVSAAELGLEKHHLRASREMANVPVEVIHEAVEAANAEGRVVTKADIKRAAGVKFSYDSKAKAGRGRRQGRETKKANSNKGKSGRSGEDSSPSATNSTVQIRTLSERGTDGRPVALNRFYLSLRSVYDTLVEMDRSPPALLAYAADNRTFFDHEVVSRVAEFLSDLVELWEADQAA